MSFDQRTRRDFITLLGGAAVARSLLRPLAARAQQPAIPVVGWLSMQSADESAAAVAAFRQGLSDAGYVEGRNLRIEYRWADGNYEWLPELAAELVRSAVAVIVAPGTPASLAAKQATTTIPIVTSTGDPVVAGLVASVARPGGNITGQSIFGPELHAKRIDLLKEIMPPLQRVAILWNADNPFKGLELMELTARTLKLELQQFAVRGPSEFEGAFERMEQGRAEAVAIDDDGMLFANARAVAALAIRRRLLSIGRKEMAQAGGLIGYGADAIAISRRSAAFVDKILKGGKPADIPVEQAAKFEFVLNLKTAKALGLAVPPTILLRADEVIE